MVEGVLAAGQKLAEQQGFRNNDGQHHFYQVEELTDAEVGVVLGVPGTLVPDRSRFQLFAKNCPWPKKGTFFLGTTAVKFCIYLFINTMQQTGYKCFCKCEFFFRRGFRAGRGRWEPFLENSHGLWCGVACPQDIEG